MGRRDDDEPQKPAEGAGVEMDEEAIRAKLLEAGWDKKRVLKAKAEDGKEKEKDDKDRVKDKDKDERRDRDRERERRSSRGSRSHRSRSRSRRRDREHDRDRDRERRSSRSSRHRASSRRRSRSRSASKSRSSSAPRSSSKRHSSSKRRASKSRSRSTSRAKEPSSKRSRRSSRSPSGSTSRKSRKRDDNVDKKKQEDKKDAPVEKAEKIEKPDNPSTEDSKKKKDEEKAKDDDETATENEDDDKREDKENGKSQEKKDGKEGASPSASHKKSRRSSRRSRSKSRSPSRSSRRRRHHSRSRSTSRSRRSRRGSRSRSRSRSHRDRDRRRRGRSASRSRSRSSRRHRRSSSRDRKRRDSHSSAIATDHVTGPTAGASVPEAPVNPTITQLMQQYPTLSLQEIIAKMQAANVSMAAAVAMKPARELYVGNLPPNITGPQLQEFLGTIIQQVGLTTQAGNPIVNTWLSSDGHFAFCEMRSVEECNLALLLNQLSLLGQPLKFGRPKSFMGPPQPLPVVSSRTQTALVNLGCTPNPMWFAASSATSDSSALGATAVPTAISPLTASAPPVAAAVATSSSFAPALSVPTQPTYNRLIMMNIPIVLNEDQVKELVEPFGKLRSFTLVKDTATGVPTASAVFEYEDASVTDQAASGLNGLDIGGIPLSVRRESATLVAPTVEKSSPVVKMANMVSADELKDDDEFADLAEDVEEECKRFGTISRLEIPRPKEGEDVPGVGSIFVRFKDESEAAAAIKALSGRKFGGNIVHVSYYPVDKFEKGEFV